MSLPASGATVLVTGSSGLIGSAAVRAQAPAGDAPVMSEQAFKNIQTLRGIPVDTELVRSASAVAASLSTARSASTAAIAGWSISRF